MVKAAFMLIIPDVSQLMFTVGVCAFTSAEATRCRLLKKPSRLLRFIVNHSVERRTDFQWTHRGDFSEAQVHGVHLYQHLQQGAATISISDWSNN